MHVQPEVLLITKYAFNQLCSIVKNLNNINLHSMILENFNLKIHLVSHTYFSK